MRIQTREDGLSIDQIVLSASTYASSAPTGTVGADGGSVGLPSTSATDITLDASKAARTGKWTVTSDSSAAGGYKIRHPDAGAAKVSSALSSPSNYFELSFNAVAGVGYRLWMRGRADSDDWDNDSVYVQFSGSVTASGSSTWRIGTTSGMAWNLEDCSGCGLSGWKWQDNGWGSATALGPLVYFSTTGAQKIRVQTREDGLSIDRIVLSPSSYLTKAPPAPSTPAPKPEPEPEPGPAPEPEPAPAPGPAPSGSTLKVLTWNIHHGSGMDGRYNIDRVAAYIVKTGANVVGLNEVERFTGWGDEDQPARFAALLKAKTGRTWYYNFAQRDGGSTGQGNLVLSTYPFESSGDYELSGSRSVARAAIIVNGVRVNLFVTHLDDGSQSTRVSQMRQLISWAASYPEQRIAMGDFNCYGSWIDAMEGAYGDAWALAVAKGYASGSGSTRSGSRIDYVFHSRSASRLTLTDALVWDGRDPSGVYISDHRPVMAIYTVR
jgi:endonuclease/exonuclease/phosphatase family metal-dependent hydrolase